MALVYDSGDEIARKTALLAPELFNTNYGTADTVTDSYDTRSDDKVWFFYITKIFLAMIQLSFQCKKSFSQKIKCLRLSADLQKKT